MKKTYFPPPPEFQRIPYRAARLCSQGETQGAYSLHCLQPGKHQRGYRTPWLPIGSLLCFLTCDPVILAIGNETKVGAPFGVSAVHMTAVIYE